MTPFKALYGYDPPSIPTGSFPVSKVQAVDELLKEKQGMMKQLKQHLLIAQNRMKQFADRKRTERHFSVGDWVYLKLQPYRQTTVQHRGNLKLSPKYFGPFEILEKVGKVAYKLNLPVGSQVHPVFHVSQLKGRVGTQTAVSPGLPVIGSEGVMKVMPVATLARRIVKKKGLPATQILVRWSNLPDSDATWEDYQYIRQQFPEFVVEDNSNFDREGVSAMTVNISVPKGETWVPEQGMDKLTIQMGFPEKGEGEAGGCEVIAEGSSEVLDRDPTATIHGKQEMKNKRDDGSKGNGTEKRDPLISDE